MLSARRIALLGDGQASVGRHDGDPALAHKTIAEWRSASHIRHIRRSITWGASLLALATLAAGPAQAQDAEPEGAEPEVGFEPGRGFRLTSADGRFELTTEVRGQIAYELRGTEGGPWQHQAQIRRARASFAGHTFDPDVRYSLEIALSPADVGISRSITEEGPTRSPLLDFYVQFTHLRDLQLRVGQYKIPSNRQRVTSSGDLQLVDRSILNAELTLDRDVGFDLRSPDFLGLGKLRYYAGLYIGRGRGARGLDEPSVLALARIEILPLGLFDDYPEVDFERGPPRLSIGLGYAYLENGRRDRGILGEIPTDEGTTDSHHVYADLVFKWRGFSALVEASLRQGHRDPGGATDPMGNLLPVSDPRDGVGANVQAGFLFPGVPFELAGRYALIRDLGQSSMTDRNELTVGASYYPGRHPYKIQLDYSRLWSDTIDRGDHRLRVQLQVSL